MTRIMTIVVLSRDGDEGFHGTHPIYCSHYPFYRNISDKRSLDHDIECLNKLKNHDFMYWNCPIFILRNGCQWSIHSLIQNRVQGIVSVDRCHNRKVLCVPIQKPKNTCTLKYVLPQRLTAKHIFSKIFHS
jgi:hypothetical protein